ncbi:MAG: hypothetical protein JSS02_09135, partial [Planctomycetes bacterium]|nr:hypothetical protein [Planctomycetota bacterium]
MSTDGDYQLYGKNLPLTDAPAFVRRAQDLETVWKALLEQCRQEREVLLEMPRLRLGILLAVVPEADLFDGLWTSSDQARYLRQLHTAWRPVLRRPHPPFQSAAELEEVIDKMVGSFRRFNQRWLKTLQNMDFRRINAMCEAYNR